MKFNEHGQGQQAFDTVCGCSVKLSLMRDLGAWQNTAGTFKKTPTFSTTEREVESPEGIWQSNFIVLLSAFLLSAKSVALSWSLIAGMNLKGIFFLSALGGGGRFSLSPAPSHI
ncbi:hypothetical protein AMECASPLE_003254 [Ameca splendens]|uniref:Uncharacterized protein n=1 Tax=Ameca splendens TaxID=208324 RepID=A0ABV0ZJL1_9TELE